VTYVTIQGPLKKDFKTSLKQMPQHTRRFATKWRNNLFHVLLMFTADKRGRSINSHDKDPEKHVPLLIESLSLEDAERCLLAVKFASPTFREDTSLEPHRFSIGLMQSSNVMHR